MSSPSELAARSAGVAPDYADDEPQESDSNETEEADGNSEGRGFLDRVGSGIQNLVDAPLDSGPVPIQDAATAYIGAVSGTEDAASEEGREQTAENISSVLTDAEEGTERFIGATSPVPTAIEAAAGDDSAPLNAYEGSVEFATDLVFDYPKFATTAATGVDPETGKRDADVDPLIAAEIGTLGGLRGVRAARGGSKAVEEAATNTQTQTMASRILSGLSRVSPVSRGGDLLGRADDAVDARFLDDASSGGRAADEAEDTDELVGGFDSFDDLGSSADNLPVLSDDAARSANDALRGDNLPVVADEAGEASSVFGDVSSRLSGAGSSVSNALDSVVDTVRRNPDRAAGAAGAAGATAAGAYAYQNIDSDYELGGAGGGGSTGNGGGDSGGGGNGDEGGANPGSSFDFGDDLLSVDWSMSDMSPTGSQTIEPRVTNETNRPAEVLLYLTAEIDGEEYIVDETTSLRLGADKSQGYRGQYRDSGPDAQKAYQLNVRSPRANGITGRTTFNLYAEGAFQVTDQQVVELGSETIVIGEGRGSEGGNEGWSQAARVYSLQYGWHLFAQRNSEGERRFMVAGKMEDGSTRYINEDGAVVDSPDFFDSEDAALAAHENWVARLSSGETGTDSSTTPDGRPSDSRVTEDAGGAGGGGSLSNITKATGVSGDGWDIGRIARVGVSVGVILFVLNRYDYIDIGSWPVVGEVV